MAKLARKHHYVPQCYLRGFCKSRRKAELFVVDFKTRSSFQTSTANVAAERDFHTIDIPGHRPDEIEVALSKFESSLSDVLNSASSRGGLLGDEEWSYVLTFISLLAVKNPRRRDTISEFQRQMWKMTAEFITRDDETWKKQLERVKRDGIIEKDITRDEARKFIFSDQYEIELSTNYHIKHEMASHDAVLQTMGQRKWNTWRAPKDSHGFITSDHPVCLFWSRNKTEINPPGYGLKNTTVFFPLSRTLALIGSYENSGSTFEVDNEMVAWANSTVLDFADRQVYGSDGDCLYESPLRNSQKRLRDLTGDMRYQARKTARASRQEKTSVKFR